MAEPNGGSAPDWETIARATVREFFASLWDFTRHRALRIGGLLLAGYVLWRCQAVVTTLIGAFVLASAAGAVVDPLCRLRLLRPIPSHARRGLVASLVLLLIVAALVGIVALFFKPFQSEFANLKTDWPTYQRQILEQVDRWREQYENLPGWVRDLAPSQGGTGAKEGASSTGFTASLTAYVTDLARKTLSAAAHVVELILLPVLAYYFIVDGRALRKELLRFLARRHQRVAVAVLHECGAIMRAFLVAQVFLAVIAGVVVGVLLGAFQIKYALTLALVAGVTRAVPVIGPLLGGIPLGVLVFVQCSQSGNYATLAVVLTIFTLMHLAESKIITPLILGDRLKLHAVVVIVALLVGGEFFGLMGMFLAAPVTALVRVLIMNLYVYPKQRAAHRGTLLSRALAERARTAGR
ncbi:MAG: AI-2E family transporter [Armatimonadota bacterium]